MGLPFRRTQKLQAVKKLLYFASDYKIGLSALLTDQLLSIRRAGVDVVAVGGENEQETGLGKSLSGAGISIIRIPGLDAHADFTKLVNTIREIALRESIDLIHVQNNWQLAIASAVRLSLLFKRKLEIAYTLHGFRHNSPVKSRIAQAVIGSALFLAADHVICMTEYLRRKFRLLSYKINLIPLGVKDDFFLPDFQEPATDCLRLVFPAQFREGKNQDLIIRAFSRYVGQTGDRKSTLTLPGSGPLLDKMKATARKLGVGQQVSFPGLLSKEDIKHLYLESNVAIVASNSETFGQSIVEPFVLGRCVVSTPVGIAPEIIQEGRNGFLFSSVQELAGILLRLSRDSQAIKSTARHNFTNRDSFNWSKITQDYISLLIQ